MSKQGFASMHPDVVREIASKGGKMGHIRGTAHKWTSEEASLAGKKGARIKKEKNNARKNQKDSYW